MGALTFGDAVSPAVAMIARGRERGYVTRAEIDDVLPHGETDADRIEDTMTTLSELGIAVAEHEEPEDEKGGRGGPKELLTAAAVPERETGEDDHGRTDDPMALYFFATWAAARFSLNRERSRWRSGSKRGDGPFWRVSASACRPFVLSAHGTARFSTVRWRCGT